MGDTRISDQRYNAIAWGLLFILWGFTILFNSIPFGIGILGTGLVLLGVNVARALNALPTRSTTTILGILALIWGVLELARPILQQVLGAVDLDWAIFAILLVALGAILLVRESMRVDKPTVENLN